MKKIYGFLGALAILSMVGCSKDDVEAGNGNQTSVKGDMFMSMTITPSAVVGSRTDTPNQTQGEVGKDRENKITNALIVFAKKASEGNYKVVTSIYAGSEADSEVIPSVSGDKAIANFKVDRNTILKAISGTEEPATTETKEFYLFVVANATPTLAGKFKANEDVQQVFETTGDEATYWQSNNFLMSNSELYKKEINAADIQPGTHTTAASAYSLNEDDEPIKIQRAMSRFDLAVGSEFTKFTATLAGRGEGDNLTQPNSDIKDLTLEFDAVALINMASSAYTFKVTAASEDELQGKTILFGKETATNWVVSPTQSNFWTPLFDGNVDEGKLTGDSKDLESFFVTEATEAAPYAVNRVGGYTTIANLRDTHAEEDNDYERPSTADPTQPAYNIWRYCMENTNPYDKTQQVNGNSTGVVFRAKMTGNKVDGSAISGATDGPLYAYGNVILGNAEGLWTYATSPKDEDDQSNVYAAVKLKYDNAVQKALDANKNEATNGEWTFEDGYKNTGESDWYETQAADFETSGKYEIHKGNLEDLKADLVENGFTVYTPDAANNYYCYYIYWNRHNDQGNNSLMNEMEFATVRNNVYKLRVNKIHKLGHPGKSDDDPDDPTPDTPDEKDSFYCEVICQILPWEVRINGIEF